MTKHTLKTEHNKKIYEHNKTVGNNMLCSASTLKEILMQHDFSFTKSLGQNFLVDKNILNIIIENSGIHEHSGVIEIGAGAGVLTYELAQRSQKVVAYELDKSLLPILHENMPDNVSIINQDVLKTDLKEIFTSEFPEISDIFVVANIPYYITTEIIMRILEEELPVKIITVMIQKEVADRIAAAPGSKEYGALSVAVQARCIPKIITKVSPHCFMPQPNVESEIICLEVRSTKELLPHQNIVSSKLFRDVVRAAFGQRRKTLVNALLNSEEFGKHGRERLTSIVVGMGFPENIRGERLSPTDFIKLTHEINEILVSTSPNLD